MSANAFDLLAERGFVQQVTDEEAVRALFEQGPVTLYVGYDPTAGSLHVGHLFTLMALMHLERSGHRPIVVLGGGTAMVGDPSGKTELRQMLEADNIQANLARFKAQISKLLDIEGGKTRCVDNSEWLLELNYIDFLRDIGRHFSVNRMLSTEAYKQRLERGLSFIELNYQLLQAYDFLELNRRHGCTLQMGGDDQWGNILAGVDLVRRVEQRTVQGLTSPLLLTAGGEKMGKTVGGAVWLDPELLSPYDYYQYWVNVHDEDVVRMLGFFTFLPMDEIRRVAELSGAQLNHAKSVLAYECTQLVHGAEAAKKAHAGALGGFGGRQIDAEILPSSTVPRAGEADMSSMPTTELALSDVGGAVPVVDLLVTTELSGSKNDARRQIKQGAVRCDGERVTDIHRVLDQPGDFILQRGKKTKHRVILS